MSEKTATVRIHIGTNPTFTERYFVEMVDTTNGANRQMRTWYYDHDALVDFLADARKAAGMASVTLTVEDTTGEVEGPAVEAIGAMFATLGDAPTDALGAPVVQLNPVQTCAEGLTREESAVAYQRVKERYGLRAAQRSRLDRAPQYSAVLVAAHRKDWRACERALAHARVID